MSVLTPARPPGGQPTAGGSRPVLALLDQADPDRAALDDAVAMAVSLVAPLEVVLLHPRLGFTTDPALAAAFHARLDAARQRLAAAVQARLAGRESLPSRVTLHPYARRPFGDPRGQARRAAGAVQRTAAAQAVHTARHLC